MTVVENRRSGKAAAALAEFVADHGETVYAAANTPMSLHDANSVWFVARGALDVFCMEHHRCRAVAAAKHLLRAEAGCLVFGLPDLAGPLTVVAKGVADTQLFRLDAAVLTTPRSNTRTEITAIIADEVSRQAHAWISDMTCAVAADIEYRPRITTLITVSDTAAFAAAATNAVADADATDDTNSVTDTNVANDANSANDTNVANDANFVESGIVSVEACTAGGEVRSLAVADGSIIGARSSDVVWISTPTDTDPATLVYLGTEVLPQAVNARRCWMPLTAHSWVTVTAGPDSTARSTDNSETGHPTKRQKLSVLAASQIDSTELLAALADFHAMVFSAEALNRQLLLADEANAQTALATHRQLAEERARMLLRSLTGAREDSAAHDTALMAALQRIGRHSGIEFREPRLAATAPPATLKQVIEASGLRARQVKLTSEDQWWRSDSGAMLAYRQDNGDPVALLPTLIGYRAVNADGSSQRVTSRNADTLSPQAWTIYPKLADDRAVTARDLLRLARHGAGSDLARFAIAGLVVALITQGPAIALGMLTDWALPFARSEALIQILVALTVMGLTAMVLSVFGAMSLLRFEARVGARLSAAAWDRLLALPLPFLRDTVSGELAVRMAAFQQVRDLLSGVVVNVAASVIFLLPTLGVLFFYDAALAAVAVAMSAVALAVIVGLGLAQIPHQRRWHTAVRDLWGRLLQFIGGITKIRASGAETAAFASWADAYRHKQVAEIRGARIDEHLAAFSSAYPFVFAAVLCAVTISRGDAVGVGDFAVVLAASFVLYGAVADLGRATDALAEAFTSYEQMTPVLQAVPERDAAVSASPTVLEGEIAVDQVSFRYHNDGPLVLDEVTLAARAGEFVAVVGGSGAGKSTLLRVMLGLDTPERGAVFFDGRDLRNLDRRAVRRQIGFVPQDGSLQPGSLTENIIGMSEDLTLEDAWRAARLAAVDRDIAEMPMQMMTMVADRAGVLSGGQIQRIRIASALARQPRILILDEATSWLDSRSQADVMNSIEGLGVTRIVIAHRLSTIRRADRIYVIDAGRVVQVGDYDELLQAPGRFRELVSRQLL